MSVDLQVDQALTLKKRARRRLVGAIALVLLMLIVLPQILQDRSALLKQAPIKITMPEVKHEQAYVINEQPVSNQINANQQQSEDYAEPEFDAVDTPNVESKAVLKEAELKENERRKSLAKASEQKVEKAVVPKAEVKPAAPLKEIKPVENLENTIIAAPVKINEEKLHTNTNASFAVQVGVYSDAANVKRLQDQLKQAGFTTSTEKVTTPKGEGLRLKAGKFSSRQDAMNALNKIREIGLPGIVITND